LKEIKISYNPVPFFRFTSVAKGYYPEKWCEVSPDQLKAIAQTYTGGISNHGFLEALTGIKKRILKKLNNFQQFKLMELVEFVNKIEPHSSFIINFVSLDGNVFTSPRPLLKGMTFGQFIFVDSFFRNYQQTKNREDLSRFLAALYLPAGKKFKEKLIENNSSILASIDAVTCEAIRLNYMLIFEWLMDLYPLVFPRDLETPKNIDKPKQRDPQSWVKIFDSLVGDDIINQDKYADLPLHNVFRFFTKNIKRRAKK
jgi:hypothetical protein